MIEHSLSKMLLNWSNGRGILREGTKRKRGKRKQQVSLCKSTNERTSAQEQRDDARETR